MEEKEKRAIDIEDMFKICVIKDEHGEDGYSLGTYKDRQALSGFYIKAKKDSLLEKVEGFFCGKFKLENDPENYRQEARIELWLSIDKYYNKLGYDDTVKGDGLIFTNCKYKAMDMAKLAKGNVSVCDRTTGKYYINKIESFEQKFIEENDKMRNQKDEKYLSEKYNIEDFNKVFTGEYETTNEFIRWFEKNKSYILTKKQIDYLNGDAIIKNASGVWIINKNIRKRVESCYANDKLKKERIKKLNKKLKNVNYLLDFSDEEDLINRLKKMSKRKDDRILMKLFEYLTKDECILLTRILNDKDYEVKNKKFYYNIIEILINEEVYINNLIENMKKEGEIPWD